MTSFTTKNLRLKKMIADWWLARVEIRELQIKQELYKTAIDHVMTQKNVDTINVDGYRVVKNDITRMVMLKENVPAHIWEQYATPTQYDAFYVRKLKQD